MMGLNRFLDVCEMCNGRELEFIFFDLLINKKVSDLIRDIPGFRCRDCGEILVSTGVLEIIDELEHSKTQYFPAIAYQEKILKLGGEDRELCERQLHSWEMVRVDERHHLEALGFRVLGDWKKIANL
ncbi:MAG: hypothetical protein K2Q26_12605 [Bdellovibrionales bacterium]|nr:hypothetical protein [Bdellovibrionales bacterium]